MEMHALAILNTAESWNWPLTSRIQASGGRSEKFKAIMPKLLSGFISESQVLGGTLLDRFWVVISQCHPRLAENGINRDSVNFDPIFEMAAELFTHLGVAFMNPGGRISRSSTPNSVSEVVSMETDTLLGIAAQEDFGIKKQVALEALVSRRDGTSCPLTDATFYSENGVNSILAHIIPNLISGNPDTMKCISMFAGTAAWDLVLRQLNNLGNFMNLETNAGTAYNDLRWGIEAQMENGTVTYIYRRIPHSTAVGPGFIRLRDGDPITFGEGPEARRLGLGPNPLVCNLRLAVARVLKMTGAAELIAQIIEDGDDSDFPHVYIASPAFCDVLTAQLLASGRALIY